MLDAERFLWAAATQTYDHLRDATDMRDSRDNLVAMLRRIADQIEDRSRLPDGSQSSHGYVLSRDRRR